MRARILANEFKVERHSKKILQINGLVPYLEREYVEEMLKRIRRLNFFNKWCGRCKIGCCNDQHDVFLTNFDIERLLKESNSYKDSIVSKRKTWFDLCFQYNIIKKVRGYCVFWDRETRRCRVDSIKPVDCVTYPLTCDIDCNKHTILWLVGINCLATKDLVKKYKWWLHTAQELLREVILRNVNYRLPYAKLDGPLSRWHVFEREKLPKDVVRLDLEIFKKIDQ